MTLASFNFKKKEKMELDIQDSTSNMIEKCQFDFEDSEKKCLICLIPQFISKDWYVILQNEFREAYFLSIIKQLHMKEKIYPPIEKIFYFSQFFPISETRVVIMGQDPYHNPGRATGLAFHVPSGIRNPPSLENIFKEVRRSYQSANCDLLKWAKQGVLLLNDTLTVTDAKPGSHSKYGWSIFTNKILEFINTNCENVVFLLWGQFAAKKEIFIDKTRHLILISSHPSPFSVLRGFQGCDHFLKTNEYLKEKKLKEIEW